MNRVTQSMLNNQLVRNLNANMGRMDKLQNQMATGRKINNPSDDPVGITYSMRYRSEISANVQYQSNVDAAVSWLEYSDVMLNQAGEVIQRVRELTVQGANGSNPPSAMEAIHREMSELYEQLVSIANSQFNGKYVFNGQMTQTPPYRITDEDMTEKDIVTDPGLIQFEIGVGVKMAVNITGNTVFGQPDEEDNIFHVLDQIKEALLNNDFSAVSDAIGPLDSRVERFLEVRADIGAKMNRIELAENRLKDININLQTLKSKTEDADMALVITNLKMSENVYQASLAAGARIIQPSLIDFLR